MPKRQGELHSCGRDLKLCILSWDKGKIHSGVALGPPSGRLDPQPQSTQTQKEAWMDEPAELGLPESEQTVDDSHPAAKWMWYTVVGKAGTENLHPHSFSNVNQVTSACLSDLSKEHCCSSAFSSHPVCHPALCHCVPALSPTQVTCVWCLMVSPLICAHC